MNKRYTLRIDPGRKLRHRQQTFAPSSHWLNALICKRRLAFTHSLPFGQQVHFFLLSLSVEMRVIKTERELAMMRTATKISSQAHVYVMRHIKPGMSGVWLLLSFQCLLPHRRDSGCTIYVCKCVKMRH